MMNNGSGTKINYCFSCLSFEKVQYQWLQVLTTVMSREKHSVVLHTLLLSFEYEFVLWNSVQIHKTFFTNAGKPSVAEVTVVQVCSSSF